MLGRTNLLLVLCLVYFSGTAQNAKWWADFNNPKLADTIRLKTVDKIATDLSQTNPDSAIVLTSLEFELAVKLNNLKYACKAGAFLSLLYISYDENVKGIKSGLKALIYLEKNNDKKTMAAVYNNLGVAYLNIADYDKSLEYSQKSLDIRVLLKDKKGMSASYNNIGNVYSNLSNFTATLDYYLRALKLREELNLKEDIALTLNNIGNVYLKLSNYEKANDYYSQSFKMRTDLHDTFGIVSCLSNLGILYQFENKTEKALEYYSKALHLAEAIDDAVGIASAHGEIGDIYKIQMKPELALEHQLKSLKLFLELDDKKGVGSAYHSISAVYLILKKNAEAKHYAQLALSVGIEIGDIDLQRLAYQCLAGAESGASNYKTALTYFEKYKNLTDTIFNIENSKQLSDLKTGFEVEKKSAELKIKSEAEQQKLKAIANEENKRNFIIIAAVAGILGVVIIFSLFLYKRFRITTKQKNIIELQKHEVEKQKDLVEEKNKEILDSITYAKRLQDATLPPNDYVKKYLPDSFVFYKPKDIVAGDFYWMEFIDETIFIAVADSTGHGVPGSIVSVVCSNALNRSLKEFGLRDPGNILDKTRELVLETFSKSGEEVMDGMDISLCSVARSNSKSRKTKVLWAGANNPLWYFKNEQLEEIKADKQHIGKVDNPKPFTTHELILDNTIVLYLFTDGLADQFGGPKGKKFKYKQFSDLLLSIHLKPFEEQKQIIDSAFNKWKNNLEQVDDITVIGIRI